MARGKKSVPVTGAVSLLAMFAVLTLVVFAVLTLSSVTKDVRLAEKSSEAVYGYYEADCQAEMILAELRQGKVPQDVCAENEGEETVYSYRCAVTETQSLQVKVRISDSGGAWQVLQWQLVPEGDWEADESITVWDGESGMETEGDSVWQH